MFEHLRIDRIPTEYILNRYSKDANKHGTFDRTDYRTLASDGCSIVYKHNEVLQLALKLVRTSSKSDEQRSRAKEGLIDLIEQVDAMGSSTAGDEGPTQDPDINGYEPDPVHLYGDMNNSENTEKDYRNMVILPPTISKTKGSGTQTKGTEPKKPSVTKPTVEAELDENGLPLGQRECSICHKKLGHNARSCPDRPQRKVVDTAKPRTIRRRICKLCKTMSGHYSSTCPLLDVALKIVAKKNAKMGTSKRGKKKVQRNEEEDEDEDDDEDDDEEDDDIEEDEDEEGEGEEEEGTDGEADQDEDEDEDDVQPPPKRGKPNTKKQPEKPAKTVNSKQKKPPSVTVRRSSRLK